MTLPQAVVFDIGNVLIEWQPERFYDRLMGEEGRRRFFAEVDMLGVNIEVDRGADFQRSYSELARAHPHYEAAILAWRDRWIDILGPDIPHSARLLAALRRRGVPVFALSNFGAATFELARARYPMLDGFDRRYISGHLRVIKPDAQIYAIVEADCGMPPEQLLFVDDRPENVEAAAQRGWRTHLFTTPAAWATRLVEEGLLSEEEAA